MFRWNLLILWAFVALVISQAEQFNVYGMIGPSEYLLGRKPLFEILAVSLAVGLLVAVPLAWLLSKIPFVEISWVLLSMAFTVLVFATTDGNLYLRDDGPSGEHQVYWRNGYIPFWLALIAGGIIGNICFLCLLASWTMQRRWKRPDILVPV
ncbi:MAG: hypothetical protein ACRC8S_22910 [Fimbriiglobus sp.]